MVSNLASLNLQVSQSGLFSIGSFLNLVFSQSGLFSIESFWGRHRQLDDSLVGQLTRIIPIEIRTRILLGLRLFLEVGSYSDLPPHEWRRRRQTRARSTNGASFAANMLGLCASRQLTHKNAKLPFLPRVEQCATREKWFSRLLWLFSHPNELIFQLDYPIVQAMFTFWYAISLKDVFLLIDFLMKRNMFKAKTTTKRLLWSDMEFVTSCTSTFV